jgi:hypothetical protein
LNKPAFAAERRACSVRAEPDDGPLTALKLSLLSTLIAEELL